VVELRSRTGFEILKVIENMADKGRNEIRGNFLVGGQIAVIIAGLCGTP
jgi:hypothetical protein